MTISISINEQNQVSVQAPNQVTTIATVVPEQYVSVQGVVGAKPLPAFGAEGQALVKSSDSSYDVEWDYIEATYLEVQNDDGTSMPAGTLVYAKGVSGNNITVGRADASSSATMPAIGVVTDEIADGASGHIITSGLFNKTISGLSGINVGDTIYVSETAGGVTTTKPTGTALIQNIGIVLKTNTNNIQKMKVSAIDRVNDIPNLAEGYIWIGDADGVPQPTLFTSLDERDNFANANLTVTGDRTHNLALNDVNFVQSNGGTSVMYLDGPRAHVGINTISPNVPLHVAGTGDLVQIGNVQIDADGNFKSKATTPSMAFKASDDTKITVQEASPGTITFDVLTGDTGTYTSTEVVRILGTTTPGQAYVGIGTANPYKKLHVSGGDALIQNATSTNTFLDVKGTSANAYIRAYSGSNSVWLYQGGSISYLQAQSGSTMRVGSGTGNLIFSDTSGEVMRTSSGNVGIGVTSPAEKLEVLGNIRLNTVGNQLEFSNENVALQRGASNVLELGGYGGIAFKASAAAIDSQTERMRITDAGNVGIGTTSPVYKLDVNGDVNIPFGTSNGYRINGNRILSQGSGFFEFGALDYKSIYPNISTNNDGTFRIQSNGSTLVTVNQSGNVGIGTTSPSDKLHVVGDVRVEGDLTVNGSYTQVDTDVLTTEQWNVTNDGTGPAVTINQKGAQDIMDVQDDGVSVFYIEDGGNVGIGTTNPAKKLHVLNSTNEAQIRLGQSGSGSYDIGVYSGDTFSIGRDADTREFTLSGGNVGIGTTSPQSLLHLSSGTSGDATLIIESDTDNNNENDNPQLQFKQDGGITIAKAGLTGDAGQIFGNSLANAAYFGNDENASVQLYTNATAALTIREDGDVGIGTTTPAANLHVFSSGNGEIEVERSGGALINLQAQSAKGVIGTDSNHPLSLKTNNGERLTISTSGFVGIGTTTPSVNLELGTDGTAEQQLRLNSDIAGAYLRLESLGNVARMRATNGANLTIQSDGGSGYITNWAGGSERMRINYDGKVGIGTTTPNYLLDVEGSGAGARIYNTAGLTNLYLTTTAGNNAILNFGPITTVAEGNIAYRTASSSMAFTTNSSEAMRIDSSGNVGIGTTTPSRKFDVNGEAEIKGLYITHANGSNPVDAGSLFFQEIGDTWGTDLYGFRINQNGSANTLNFQSANLTTVKDIMTLTRDTAYVGIGTTSPSQKLQVSGGDIMIDSDYAMHFTSTADFTKIQRSNNALQFFTNSTDMLSLNDSGSGYFNGSGNFGIGTTSPTSKLEVAGAVRASGLGSYFGNLATNYSYAVLGAFSNGVNNIPLVAKGYSGQTADLTRWVDSSNNILNVVDASGNVGIGTTSPSEEFEVVGDAKVTNLGINASADGYLSSLSARLSVGGNIVVNTSNPLLYLRSNNTGNDSDIRYQTALKFTNGSGATHAVINSSGNVGIGTASPDESLHVNGKILVAANDIAYAAGYFTKITSNYSDSPFVLESRAGTLMSAKDYGRTLAFYAGPDGSTAEVMRVDESGNVGIGTTTPVAALNIGNNGNIRIDGNGSGGGIYASSNGSNNTFSLTRQDGVNAGDLSISGYSGVGITGGRTSSPATSSYSLYVKSDGNVGIGTTSPSTKLHILQSGTAVSSDGVSSLVVQKSAVAGTSAAINIVSGDSAEASLRFGDTTDQSMGALRYLNDVDAFSIVTNNTDQVRITSNGRVGIGTTSPYTELHVESNDAILTLEGSNSSYVNAAVQLVSNHATNARGMGTFAYDASTDVEWFWGNPYSYNDAFVINRNTGYTVPSSQNSPPGIGASAGTLFKIASSGNVGIGTTSPAYPLDVNGNIRATAYRIGGGTILSGSANVVLGSAGATSTVSINTTGGTALTVDSSANVGIGTTSPSSKLDVSGGVTASGPVDSSDGTNTSITSETARFNKFGLMTNRSSLYFTNQNASGSMQFGIGGVHSANTKMYLSSAGRLGIGTTSPSAKLDVVGLANINDGSNNVMISSGNTALTTGVDNTTLGYRAGINLTSGNRNTVVGKDALFAAATATTSDNTAVGNSALFQVTGDNNVGIGRNAGLKAATANVAVGNYSLDDNTGSFNVSVGYGAIGAAGSTASNTVAVGYQALYDLTSGAYNTAVGHQSLTNITTAQGNTAVGYNAGFANILGTDNSFVGAYSGANSTGSSNTTVGYGASYTNTTGDNNTAIGRNSLFHNTTGSNNTVIGRNAAFGASGASTFSNAVAVGYEALYDLTTGVENTAVGLRASANTTTGGYNVSLGNYALRQNQTASANTALGYGSAYETTSGNNTAVGYLSAYYSQTHNAALGARALNYSTGSYNVAVGSAAAQGVYGVSNYSNTVAVGYSALVALTTGSSNTGVGYRALASNLTGGNNTAVGNIAGVNITGGNNTVMGFAAGSDITGGSNTAIGWRTGEDVGSDNTMVGREAGRFTTSNNNVAIGNYAAKGVEATSTFSNTVAVGYQALTALTTGAQNTAVGYQAASAVSTASSNTAIGYEALKNSDTGYNTSVGAYSLRDNTLGERNTAVGWYASMESTGGYNASLGMRAGRYGGGGNTAIGYDAATNTTGNNNVIIGREAGLGVNATSNYSNTVAVGYQALHDLTTGTSNTAVGFKAGTNITNGGSNTSVGFEALATSSTADNNSAFGKYALRYNTTGYNNTGVGTSALYNTAGGANNVAVGLQALYGNTSGSENTAVGLNAGYNNITGSRNIFLGYRAGLNETGSDKLYIANSDTSTPLIYGDFNLGEITINGDLNVSGGNVKADAIEISGRAMTTPATGEYGSGSKLVTQFATGTVTAGKVYVANAGAWAEGDANAGSTSIGMIAVATDAASATEMLIEGVIKLSSNTGFSGAAAGTVLYLSTTAGELTTTAPSTAGEYVRVCGYVVNASTNEVFFSASRDWTAL